MSSEIVFTSVVAIVAYKTCEHLVGDKLTNWFKQTKAAAKLRWLFRNMFGG